MLLPSPPDNFGHFVGLAVGNHQWRSKPDDVVVGGLCDHTVIQQLQGKVPSVLLLVGEFNAQEQSATSHFLNATVREYPPKGLEELLSLFSRIFAHLFVYEYVQRSDSNSRCERVPTISGPVLSWLDQIHDLSITEYS